MAGKRRPDFDQFLKILRREATPSYLPFFELHGTADFIARYNGVPVETLYAAGRDYWRIWTEFWVDMGFDNVPLEVSMNLPVPMGHGKTTEGSEAHACIRNWEDFEKYPWPDVSRPFDFEPYEIVGSLLPEGVKMVAGPGGGPYEWTANLIGTIGLAYMLADDPELVGAVFAKLHDLYVSGVKQLATMDSIGAIRQGDDLGFKTSTFLCPDDLRKYVFPIYKSMVDASHEAGKPFILHSCGNLADVYEDLISHCGIDAKHSFEDVIMPVSEFKRRYGDRCTPIGGLDVDLICRGTEDEIRAYTRRVIEDCFYDGYWILGTGNSLTNYMPVRNYMYVLDEGMRVTV